MLLEQEYNFDAEQTREYFPMQHVTQATMEIYQELLGLKFAQVQDAETWQDDVLLYETRDSKSDKVLGHFYLDLHVRDHKRGHASVSTIL